MVNVEVDAEPLVDQAVLDDIAKFEEQLARNRSGDLSDEVFRVFRLNNGVYGQRQGGDNQMLRVKVPAGILDSRQLDMLGHIADHYSRGWGHITTRQNLQFHFVQLDAVADALRDLASVGLTSREACGDTVRNVQGCHLAGACPQEVFDITAWAQATYRHFLRNPIAQRMPRKFKINFSGCDTDCGQGMFNDVGVIATRRVNAEGTTEDGFRIFIAGGLGANPHPAVVLEDFTPKADLLPTIESCLRVFDNLGNRDNKLRARMKWLIDSLGIEEVRERVFRTRKFLVASSSWPGGIPEEVLKLGDAAAGVHSSVTPTAIGGTPVVLTRTGPYERWEDANVIRGVAKGTVSAYSWARLGDVTSSQFRGLASIQREFGAEVRVTNRQNFVFRNLNEQQLPVLFARLEAFGMAQPGAELARDVVACPGADTCNLAFTQSRGLADEIGRQLDDAGLAEVGGVRTNISGCPNSCGQHHAYDIGFFGAERRAHGRPAPGYQMLLGGHVAAGEMRFGTKALRLPAKAAATAVVRVVGRYSSEREVGEEFHIWLDRVGGAKEVAADLADLDEFPTPEGAPDFYVDYDETGPYEALIGDSECAT
jgi:sulfite reductase (ferredoxin)